MRHMIVKRQRINNATARKGHARLQFQCRKFGDSTQIDTQGPERNDRARTGRRAKAVEVLAPERTLHMTSFTKLIAPGVRLGFMIGDATILAKIGKVAEDTYISPGYFAHGVTYEWLKAGKLEPQIAKLKALYAPRLEACLAALDKYIPDAVATRPDGGFFLSLTLPQGVSTTDLRAAASKLNLNLADGLAFFPQGGGERFLRLPFCALSPAQIDEGIRRLAEAVKAVRR